MRCAATLALAMVLLSCGVAAAQDRKLVPTAPEAAGRRVALVVGNNAYPKTSALHNAVADAVAIGQALGGLGFGVDLVRDATQEAFERAVDRFVNNVQAGDVALFYYSGHGLEVRGENYLVPVDFAAQDEVQVKRRAVAAGEIEERLQARGARVRILVLDACRDNPYRAVRSGAGGLAAMAEARGALIAFATGPGKTASDNPGGTNGLFTQELLAVLREPGLTVSEVFRRVRERVDRASGARQTPWVADGLIGDFALGAAGASAPSSTIARTDAAPAAAVPGAEQVAWQAVANTTNREMLEQFVAAFPNGQYAAAARLKIAALAESAAAETAARAKVSELLVNGKAANDRRDYAGALRYYLEAAQAGSTRAMVSAGALYENPNLAAGVPRDYGQAVSWYRKAAEAGDAEGMNKLAWMYRTGQGVAKDEAQSVFWDGKAAAAGNVRAMSTMGWRYKDGVGVGRDAAQSTSWYRKAAEAGDVDATLIVAEAYLSGRGVQRDYAQAMALYRKVAEAHEGEYGRAAAMTALGRMYARGAGVAQDDKEAASWFRKAAEAGNADAMLQLGQMCEEGRGVPIDLQQAAAWYRKAADTGSYEGWIAMEQLERLYEEGRGVPKDPRQAAAWHEKAASTPLALHRQTVKRLRPADDIFRYGKAADGRRDYTEALALYRKAAEAGNTGAMAGLGGMYAMGHGVARDDAQAVAWFQKSAAAGDDEGMEQLGEMYEQGRGVPRDLEQALTWYRKAAAAGNEKAGEGLLRLGRT